MACRYQMAAVATILIALTTAYALAQSQQTFRVVGVEKGDVLNMRSEPNSDASIVSKIPPDATSIVRVGACKVWCKVRYKQTTGWVVRRHLAAMEAVRTPKAEAAIISTDPVGDCNSNDAVRKLAGCSALLKRATLPPAILAIAHSRRSDAHLDAGDLDAAIADRSKALELHPDDPEYKTRLVQSFLQRAASWALPSKAEAALRDYTAVIRLLPTSHAAYVGRSGIHLLVEDYDNAIADLHTAMKHHDAGKDAYRSALSRVYERRGAQQLLKKEHDQAIAALSKAIDLVSPERAPYTQRAHAYAAKGQTELALKDYSQAMRINPDNVEAYIGRGEVYRGQAEFAQALNDFDKAIAREPSNVMARMLRALTREEAKDRDGAIAEYQAVLKLEPKHNLARAGVERLRVETLSADADPETAPGGTLPRKPSEEALIRQKQYQCCRRYFKGVSNPQDVPHVCRTGIQQGTNFCSLIGVQAPAAKKTRGYSQNCCTTLPNGSVHCAFSPGCKRRPGDPAP